MKVVRQSASTPVGTLVFMFLGKSRAKSSTHVQKNPSGISTMWILCRLYSFQLLVYLILIVQLCFVHCSKNAQIWCAIALQWFTGAGERRPRGPCVRTEPDRSPAHVQRQRFALQ